MQAQCAMPGRCQGQRSSLARQPLAAARLQRSPRRPSCRGRRLGGACAAGASEQQPQQLLQAAEGGAAADAPLPAAPPPAKVVARRGMALPALSSAAHKPLGLVLFSAYVLGAASSVAGMPGPVWLPTLAGAAIGATFAALNRFCSARLWRHPAAPLNVVITGGTKGLGKALAREFLSHGDSVLITGTSEASVAAALTQLRSEVSAAAAGDAGSGSAGASLAGRLHGVVCDVSLAADVDALAAAATAALGSVDVWVANAGVSGSFKPFLDASPAAICSVVRTNLLGGLLTARAAARTMLRQGAGGHVFLLDGAGSDGGATPQYAAYGATKAALPQLAATLRSELSGTHVGVHVLSPGMMLTELLLAGATRANKAAFNLLCEHPETVAAFLVPRVRSAVCCGLNGTYTRYLTPASALGRLLTAPWRIGRFFDASGNPVYSPEAERLLGRGARATARRQALARARSSGLGLAYSLSLALCFVAIALEGNASAFTGH